MYIKIQTFSYGVDIVFYFTSLIVEEVHIGLIGIAKGKIEKIFGLIILF